MVIFRGENIVTHEFAYGDLYQHGDQTFIMQHNNKTCEVIRETVAQSAGATDERGNEIFIPVFLEPEPETEYHEGELPLFHMDVYRLDDAKEDFGLDDYLNQDGVCIIEWPEMIDGQLPEERLDIKIKVIDDDTRVLVFTPYGQQYEELCEAVL